MEKLNKIWQAIQAKDLTKTITRVFPNPILYLGIIALSLIILFKIVPPQEGFSAFSSACEEKINPCFLESKEIVAINSYEPIVIAENSFKQSGPITSSKGRTSAALAASSTQRREIIRYLVQPGDTLSSIAQKFDLSLNTILEANDLSSRSTISPGQELIILPVDGLTHLVGKGESIGYLAKLYQADAEDIIIFNQLSDEDEIFSGDLLIIPGGKKPVKKTITYAPLASSYFICPIPAPCGISQGLHWYNAIDFSNNGCGESVFAVAGGQVQRTGYHYLAGNFVQILHPNGVVTFYGHLSKILVVAGQKVSQGETIGYIGNTGYTVGVTGCHLHFEVRGARNPFAY